MQGSELRALRRAAGMTQGEMAKALGLSHGYIGEMERGEKPIELRTELAANIEAVRAAYAALDPDRLGEAEVMRLKVELLDNLMASLRHRPIMPDELTAQIRHAERALEDVQRGERLFNENGEPLTEDALELRLLKLHEDQRHRNGASGSKL